MGYKIAIVEDDGLILELLSVFFNNSGKFDKVHEYSNGKSFINDVATSNIDVDVVILDYRLGDTNAEHVLDEVSGFNFTKPIIVLTSNYNQYLIGYMIKLGVSGYLPKNIKPVDLLGVVEEVITKGHYISQDQFPFLKVAFSTEQNKSETNSVDITKREIEVIYLLANQCTAKEIGEKLFVSSKTIEGYKNNLFSKTGTRSVVGLVIFAIQHGLIKPESIDLALGQD